MRAFLIAVMFLTSIATASEKWEASVKKNGVRTITSAALATTPDGNFPASLTLQCSPGKDGTISFIYTVTEPDQIKQFPFDQFEGT
ncbi:hypothetical protein L0156_01980 [bacterium]|nr:hypothetical protein [bacterium]